MAIGMIAGIVVGILAQNTPIVTDITKFLGDIFIRLIRMVVVPLVFATLVAGAAGISDTAKLGRVAVKTMLYYLLTTMASVAIGLLLANIMHPGAGLNLSTEGLQANIRPEYNSFAPRIRLEWTPGQYYYMNGKQKVNLKSRFPTFILDYERGLRNVFKSTGVYERIEFDMQHHIRTGLLANLYYRFGVGLFTNQEETYFVDFVNFRRNNLPEGWNDEIGGVFQALDGQWYNASPYYVRAHVSYEAPFLIMRHLIKYTNHIQNERLYLNMLTMDNLGPYFEVGYGIGTFVFDMGLFVSLEKFNKVGFGYKFTFELFSK